MEPGLLRRWIGAVLAIGGVVYALFWGPLIGAVVCLVGVAILVLGSRSA